MIIEKTNKVLKKNNGGRPAFYPFDELTPGTHLKIGFEDHHNIKRAVMHVSSALSNFKRRNNLRHWQTKVRRQESYVYVYRIK